VNDARQPVDADVWCRSSAPTHTAALVPVFGVNDLGGRTRPRVKAFDDPRWARMATRRVRAMMRPTVVDPNAVGEELPAVRERRASGICPLATRRVGRDGAERASSRPWLSGSGAKRK
jgi:hypothetical protein